MMYYDSPQRGPAAESLRLCTGEKSRKTREEQCLDFHIFPEKKGKIIFKNL